MGNSRFTVGKKDLEITWFSGTGGGGQYRNKHRNCCRVRHPASGIIATGQSHRSRIANQKEAFQGLVRNPRFRFFCELGLREAEGKSGIEEAVAEAMAPEAIEEVEAKRFKTLVKGRRKEKVDGGEIYS